MAKILQLPPTIDLIHAGSHIRHRKPSMFPGSFFAIPMKWQVSGRSNTRSPKTSHPCIRTARYKYLPTPHNSEVPELPRGETITQELSQHRDTIKEASTENANKEQRGYRHPPPPPASGNNRPLPPSYTLLRPMLKSIQASKSQKPKTSGQARARP